ncbi:aryl-alcohol oxidase [Coprinopsis sp. MPI-PUGE-AT-0042]|nr:aryl-alcohol oxidase [Coprinopsis sp. MPI-PUGE-AT-0042]
MGVLSHFVAVFLALHSLPAASLLAEDFSSFPATEYDFVIVGGGTAGCVVASRLSEDPSFNVLLIEAGPNHEGHLDLAVPGYTSKLYGSEFDWGYTSVPQVGLNNRTEPIARGYVLGGSSSINGQVYTRGSSNDWDRYAAVTGDAGWAWDNILPYFLKGEKWSRPSDGHDTTGKYDPAFHSDNGLLGTSLSGVRKVVDDKLLNASLELGGEFKYELDMNDGVSLGIGWIQSTVENGTRASSATAYLGPSQISRTNLHVLVNHRAVRLLQSGNQLDSLSPTFRTVTFKKDNNTSDAIFNVTATKEVVLSAGAYGTPQLLLLSGIGDAAALNRTGVEAKVHLPDVGRNLSDHVIVGYTWNLGIDDVIDSATNSTMQEEFLSEWLQDHTGPLCSIGLGLLGGTRLPQDWQGWERFEDPAAGEQSPHIELLFPNAGLYPKPGPTMSIWALLLTPTSRGTVSLNASDPLGHPLIDSNLLDSEFDISLLREAFNTAERLLSASTWADWNLTLAGDAAGIDNDEDFYNVIRNTATHGLHPVGSASMSPVGASYGVVDPDLKVKKVSGLRIVDASVLPYVTSSHIQAPVYAIAERAADLVKASWNPRP